MLISSQSLLLVSTEKLFRLFHFLVTFYGRPEAALV